LRNIRAKDLRLRGGAHLGAGAFGAVQLGEWGDVEVAVKSNSVSCLDVAAIAREREMYVSRVSVQHSTGQRGALSAGLTRWAWMFPVFFL
jgi:hypothetical protein